MCKDGILSMWHKNDKIRGLMAEVAFLERGIEAYREAYQGLPYACRGGGCTCHVHAWEREAKERERADG